jgi:patatin-like phospholipase/acyl hydrolase
MRKLLHGRRLRCNLIGFRSNQIKAIRSKSSLELRVAVGAFISQSWVSAAITALNANNPEIAMSIRELDWWKLERNPT